MKIAVRRGHQRTGRDGCAEGILNEIDVANAYYVLVMDKLRKLGHEVLDVTPPENNRSLSDSLYYGINKANNWKADLFISCHANNAYNTYDGSIGCEVIYHRNSTKGKEYATKVEKELANLGFNSRGAKVDVRGLAEINNTNCPCIIVEPFFLEATGDVATYKRVGAEGIANAIVKGIVGKTIQSQPKIESYIKLDGGGTILEDKHALNLIIRDFKNIDRIFAYVDNDKKASWAFDINPANDNYVKLEKNCSKAINKRNEGYTFSPNSNYKIRVEGYKNGKIVTKNEVVLKTLDAKKDNLYRVQVGAFKNKDNADKLKEELKENGYNGFIKEK